MMIIVAYFIGVIIGMIERPHFDILIKSIKKYIKQRKENKDNGKILF